MSEFQSGLKEANKDVRYGILWFTKWFVVILVIGTIIGWGLQSAGIISMNIQRETVQHSQQYVETKVNLLNKLYGDYLDLDAEIAELSAGDGNDAVIRAKQSQQANIIKRLRTEAGMIPDSQVPTDVLSLLAANRR